MEASVIEKVFKSDSFTRQAFVGCYAQNEVRDLRDNSFLVFNTANAEEGKIKDPPYGVH